jgi:glycosyltransferase involved in cell wall biosynthesis
MIRWTLQRAAAAIAVSSALRDKTIEAGGLTTKTLVIPNGIDAERFQRLPQEYARAQLGLPSNGQLIVSVGALVPLKGHKLLIEAAAKVMARFPDLRLYVLGEGEGRAELESLIGSLRLRDRIKLLGKRPNTELGLWYSAADISCLASEREGWPNVLTESLACGTPVIGTRVGGIPEIVHSPELGVLVHRTVEAISQGIEQGLSKRWNREWISEETRSRTWPAVAAEVEDVLRSTLPKAL